MKSTSKGVGRIYKYWTEGPTNRKNHCLHLVYLKRKIKRGQRGNGCFITSIIYVCKFISFKRTPIV